MTRIREEEVDAYRLADPRTIYSDITGDPDISLPGHISTRTFPPPFLHGVGHFPPSITTITCQFTT